MQTVLTRVKSLVQHSSIFVARNTLLPCWFLLTSFVYILSSLKTRHGTSTCRHWQFDVITLVSGMMWMNCTHLPNFPKIESNMHNGGCKHTPIPIRYRSAVQRLTMSCLVHYHLYASYFTQASCRVTLLLCTSCHSDW